MHNKYTRNHLSILINIELIKNINKYLVNFLSDPYFIRLQILVINDLKQHGGFSLITKQFQQFLFIFMYKFKLNL